MTRSPVRAYWITWAALLGLLAATFAAPRERVEADVASLLQGLVDKKLLEL